MKITKTIKLDFNFIFLFWKSKDFISNKATLRPNTCPNNLQVRNDKMIVIRGYTKIRPNQMY
jgi:hypothetical protein